MTDSKSIVELISRSELHDPPVAKALREQQNHIESQDKQIAELKAVNMDHDLSLDIIRGTAKTNSELLAVVDRLVNCLDEAMTGLDWYHDTYPEADSGADGEFTDRAKKAIELAGKHAT